MTAPELNKIEVGNELAAEELSLIENLDKKAFDVDANIDDQEELRNALKTTTINVVTSASDAAKTTEAKTLVDIATQFDQYVEKGDGWKLKVIEGKTDTPAWITHIIENPQNNDLAYFVQKLAKIIAYQTATAYTETEINAVEVGIDKSFGNQTRRALKGLKSWIENNEDYKTVAEGSTYTGKYLDKVFIEGAVSTKETDADKTTILAKYNLQYKDAKIQPKDGYEFIDPYSDNLAVKVSGDNESQEEDKNNFMQDKISAYEKATTEEAKNSMINELESYLTRTYTDYTGKGFHKNLATAILTKKDEFTWNNKTYYPVVDATGKIAITDSSDDAKTKKNEIERAANEEKRQAKAKIYAEKVFPESLNVVKAGDVYYLEIPEVSPQVTPASIGQIPFSSEENAKKFIDISKTFVQEYGYSIGKDNRKFAIMQKTYLKNINGLIASSGVIGDTRLKAKIGLTINQLACWTHEF